MKTLFVKVLAMTVGVVVGLSLVGIGLYWFTHRRNSNSVTAKLIKYGIYERDDKPKEPHFYTQLYFDVTNNTSSDYTLPIKVWKDRLMESHTGSLIGSSGWEVSLVQGSMPYNIPSGFFDPKPIFIPAHTTVQILFVNETAYSPEVVAGKTKQQVAEKAFDGVDDLVLLDDEARYRVDFAMKDFWKSPPKP
jgi:hypothetical protein